MVFVTFWGKCRYMYKKFFEFVVNLGGGKMVLDKKKNKVVFVWILGIIVIEYV